MGFKIKKMSKNDDLQVIKNIILKRINSIDPTSLFIGIACGLLLQFLASKLYKKIVEKKAMEAKTQFVNSVMKENKKPEKKTQDKKTPENKNEEKTVEEKINNEPLN